VQTQLAEREQQPSIVLVLVEPLLGLFDLCDSVVGLAIAVQCDQLAVPLRIQALGK